MEESPGSSQYANMRGTSINFNPQEGREYLYFPRCFFFFCMVEVTVCSLFMNLLSLCEPLQFL